MIKNIIPILIFLLVLVGCSKDSNSPAENNNQCTITGKITDRSSGVGISGVAIQTIPVTTGTTTNQTGNYTLSNITPGNYQVTASKTGYNPASTTVNASAGNTETADMMMAVIVTAPTPPALASPLNGGTNISSSPEMRWIMSQNAMSYNIQVSATNTFSDIVSALNVSNGTSITIIGLDYSITYYWRVQGVNGSVTSSWSDVWSFSTEQFACGKPVTYSGKTYNTLQIGTQCWFKENLDVGNMVLGSVPSDNGKIEKYCYNDLPINCSTYGGLYLWNEAMNYSLEPGVKGICPANWHIPTKEEFDILIAAVNGNGNSLKLEGIGTGEGVGTNTTGFSALLPGHGHISAACNEIGWTSFMWSSTYYQIPNVYYLQLSAFNNSVQTPREQRTMAFSVRCLKD